MRFQAILQDLRTQKVFALFPVIVADSHGEAVRLALKRLKARRIYRDDADVQEFVRIAEMGQEFSPAGFEFDVLPEALRRLSLEVSCKTDRSPQGEEGGSCGGCSGPCGGNCSCGRGE